MQLVVGVRKKGASLAEPLGVGGKPNDLGRVKLATSVTQKFPFKAANMTVVIIE